MNSPIPNATTLKADPAAAEAWQLAEALTVLTAGALSPTTVGAATFVNVPPGYKQEDISAIIERRQPAPNRKQGTTTVKSLDSLLAVCADQSAAAQGYIYADPDARTITAVFNDQRDTAGWRDHRAHFAATYTPEFEKWLRNNGADKAKGQTEFAEFIEDNLADITEPSAQMLLDVATTIQAITGINFSSAKRLDNGQVQLGYTETIDARAGANGALAIPREFALGLRIFKNGDGYKLKARLKYRMNSGSVKFWYELDRPERAIEDAFAGYVTTVREKSGYAVLIAAAPDVVR